MPIASHIVEGILGETPQLLDAETVNTPLTWTLSVQELLAAVSWHMLIPAEGTCQKLLTSSMTLILQSDCGSATHMRA